MLEVLTISDGRHKAKTKSVQFGGVGEAFLIGCAGGSIGSSSRGRNAQGPAESADLESALISTASKSFFTAILGHTGIVLIRALLREANLDIVKGISFDAGK